MHIRYRAPYCLHSDKCLKDPLHAADCANTRCQTKTEQSCFESIVCFQFQKIQYLFANNCRVYAIERWCRNLNSTVMYLKDSTERQLYMLPASQNQGRRRRNPSEDVEAQPNAFSTFRLRFMSNRTSIRASMRRTLCLAPSDISPRASPSGRSHRPL